MSLIHQLSTIKILEIPTPKFPNLTHKISQNKWRHSFKVGISQAKIRQHLQG